MWMTISSLVLRNWKYILVSLTAAFICGKIVSIYYEGRLQREVAAAIAAEQAACAAAQKITEEANSELAKKYNDTRRKLDAAKRMSAVPKCLLPTHTPNTATDGGEHARQNGISTDWLREYAAECRNYQVERGVLETFIMETWELNRK